MLDELDRTRLLRSFQLWPERLAPYGHPEREPDFTESIEELGAFTKASIQKGSLDIAALRHFLIKVGYWKMPRQLASHEKNVNNVQGQEKKHAEAGKSVEHPGDLPFASPVGCGAKPVGKRSHTVNLLVTCYRIGGGNRVQEHAY